MDKEPTFFDFAAEVGLTKHIGGLAATEALVALCRIDQGKRVLDVGCGVGVTPCFIAKRYGSRVAGVDISEHMIERSRERAEQEGMAGPVDLTVADAQALPFAGGVFDAVITESVTAFPEDKQKAVDEYARVTKPGGYVGLNESVWWKVPVPPEVVAWAAQDIGANVQPLTVDAWKELLKNAGLQEVATRTYPVDTRIETRGILQRYGWRGMLRVFWRIMLLYVRSPAYRGFVGEVQRGGLVPANLAEYFGYGLFVGQKP
jgi:ubiquinone/menaquinone biosynthesis C-methylase UbiE